MKNPTKRGPFVTITSTTRAAVEVEIRTVWNTVSAEQWEDALTAIMRALQEACVWDEVEREPSKKSKRRRELLEVARTCQDARLRIITLTEAVRGDLFLIEAETIGTPDGLVNQFKAFRSKGGLDPVREETVRLLQTTIEQATAAANRLADPRTSKPRRTAVLFLIDRLGDIFDGFGGLPPDDMTDQAWRRTKAKFVRAVFAAVAVTCRANQVRARLKETEALELDLLSGNLT